MQGTDPRSLLLEQPLLIYPVGDWDESASELQRIAPEH